MAFRLLTDNINTSLLGTADPLKFVDANRLESNDLYARKIHGSDDKNRSIRYTIIIIIISAIIFVTVVSLYDIIRGYITNYFANKALHDPKFNDTTKDINNRIVFIIIKKLITPLEI